MIVIGSNTARRAFVPGAAVYGMTKAAVARLVHGLALDFAEKKIAVIDVQPGPTATDMAPRDEAHRAWIANASPEKRIADADEIARFHVRRRRTRLDVDDGDFLLRKVEGETM